VVQELVWALQPLERAHYPLAWPRLVLQRVLFWSLQTQQVVEVVARLPQMAAGVVGERLPSERAGVGGRNQMKEEGEGASLYLQKVVVEVGPRSQKVEAEEVSQRLLMVVGAVANLPLHHWHLEGVEEEPLLRMTAEEVVVALQLNSQSIGGLLLWVLLRRKE